MSNASAEQGGYRLTCIGDVFGDEVIDLLDTKFSDAIENLSGGTNLFASIRSSVGGSGVQLASAATSAGFGNVSLVGTVGGQDDVPDSIGRDAIDMLVSARVNPLLRIESGRTSGRVVVLYLSGSRRLMVSDPGANGLFSRTSITDEIRATIEQSDVVHASGYTWLGESRREATLELLSLAREAGGRIAFDAAPHDLDEQIPARTLLDTLYRHVDWLFVEDATARRLAHQARTMVACDIDEDATIGALLEVCPVVCIHKRPGHMIVARCDGRVELEFPETGDRTGRGRSSSIQAQVMRRLVADEI